MLTRWGSKRLPLRRLFSTDGHQQAPPVQPEPQKDHQQQQKDNQQESNNKRRRPRWALRVVALSVAAAGVSGAALYAGTQTKDAWLTWSVVRHVPLNALSRLAGDVAHWPVPRILRRPLFGLYAWVYGADLSEAERPVDEYGTVQAFFTRRLKAGSRLGGAPFETRR